MISADAGALRCGGPATFIRRECPVAVRRHEPQERLIGLAGEPADAGVRVFVHGAIRGGVELGVSPTWRCA